jgi:hypothetical protein
MWEISGGYTDVIGFEIDGSGSGVLRIGIAFSGGNSSLQNSHVHDVAMTTVCDNQGGAGVHTTQADSAAHNNYDISNNVIHHVGGTCGYISAIYHQSSGNIRNNLVYASSYGINLYHDDHDTNIVNNTVFGNSGYGILYGGCQESYTNPCPTSGMRIYNNIVYDNGGGVQGPTSATDVDNILKNNLIYKNTNQFDLASPSSSTRSGEVMADPQFVNYIRTGGGDYHLKSTSPAINRGLSALSPFTAPSTDLDGNLRKDGAIDIGAYEYGASVSPTPAPTPVPTPTPAPPPMPSRFADVSFSPSSVVFPSQLVGSASAVVSITMKNTGSAVLDLSKTWSISGDFAFGNVGTCDISLAPGATCTVSLKFAPTAVGLRSGKFTILDNTLAGSHSGALSGNGISAAAPVATPSVTSLNFGTVRVGSTSSVKYVTIKNTGNAVLNFGAVSTSGDFQFANKGNCGASLAVGASCTFSAKFVPKATGTRTGVMSLMTNASSSPLKIQLVGTGSN